MAFHPPLSTTTFVPLPSPTSFSSPSSRRNLHFTYLAPTNHPQGATPEIWTDLPFDGDGWHAIPLKLSSSSCPALYTISVDLSAVTVPKSFEYTYRLAHPSGETQWLGQPGSNGHVEVVAAPSLESVLNAAPQLKADGRTRWKKLDENVALGTFKLKEGGKSGQAEDFEVTEVLQSTAGEAWSKGQGVVWEQSARTWIVPRILPSAQAIPALSPTYPAQLLVLRSPTSAASPIERDLVLFPFSTHDVCSSLVGGENSQVLLRCERDSGDAQATGHLAVAWGETGKLHELVSSCVAAARSSMLNEPYEAPSSSATAVAEEALTTPSHALGLCTWNALGPHYTLSDTLAWLDGLELTGTAAASTGHAAAGTLSPLHGAVKTVLLDDGWQDTASYIDYSDPEAPHSERRALRSFGVRRGFYDLGGTTAAPSAAPSAPVSGTATPSRHSHEQTKGRNRSDSGYGRSPDMSLSSVSFEDLEQAREGVSAELCDTVRRIKERGVEKVGVWMTLLGYWHGLHPDGALADAYDLRLTTFRSTAHPKYSYKLYLPSPADLSHFYHDYFASLKAAGIDFVKVDDQATIDALVSQEQPEDAEEPLVDPGELKHLLLVSMRRAALDIFGPSSPSSTIHCMSGSPRIMGGSLGVVGSGPLRSRSILRTSDDFFPLEPDSHRWHLAHNSFSTVLTSALRFSSCFDMAQAKHKHGEQHLALRAFSDAPVWSTDVPVDAAMYEAEGEEEGKVGKEEKEKEESPLGWTALIATTKAGPRVLQARSGSIGSVLEGRLFDDVVRRYTSPSSVSEDNAPALKVGVAFPLAQGAHLGVWNCLPGGETARTVVDTKDLGDALGAVADELVMEDEAASLVVFSSMAEEGSFVKEMSAAELNTARPLSHSFSQPITAFNLPTTTVKLFSLARVFELTGTPSSSGSSKTTVKIACLGLLDKTVGLGAARDVDVVLAREDGEEAEFEEDEEGQSVPASPALTPTVSSRFATPSSLDSPLPSPAEAVTTVASSLLPASSPSPRSTPRPIPQARLPFLLAYLTGYLNHTFPSSSTQPRRTPTVELRSLLRDLFRRPIRTAWTELSAVVGFGFAAVVWALSGRTTNGNGGIQAAPVEEERVVELDEAVAAGEATTSTPPTSPAGGKKEKLEEKSLNAGKEHLSVLLDFVSPHVGFYVSSVGLGAAFSSSSLRFELDGKEVESTFVKEEKGGRVVEVDAEGAWKAAGGKVKALKRGGEGEVRPWRLTVAVA
ncbi:hypothetical protein JCM8547_004074 [Rhodosporidiobolus lusitaniae]